MAKLELDRIDELFRAGHLRPEHVQASAEIREVFGYWSAALGCTTSEFSGVPGTGFSDPLEKMPASVERAWRLRYSPWASEMGHDAKLVLDVVADNWWPASGALRKWARAILRRRLWRYAKIAGWVR